MSKEFQDIAKSNRNASLLGISTTTASIMDRYIPSHWHDEIEVLYCLNGSVDVVIEKKKYELPSRRLIIIDSQKVHHIKSNSDVFMFMVMHIRKRQLMSYVPDIDFFKIDCHPLEIDDPKFEAYIRLCRMAGELTELIIKHGMTSMKSDGLALVMFSEILENFAIHLTPEQKNLPAASITRIHDVLSYVNNHYQDTISIAEMADMLGFTKEYFCHYFKKFMGISFLNYLMRVRISHFYHNLLTSDDSVSELMEKNGIFNQKVFNRTFKELYGCTPRDARRKKNSLNEYK